MSKDIRQMISKIENLNESTNVRPITNKVGDNSPYDENIKMRKLTPDEQNLLLNHRLVTSGKVDINQDVAFRYINSKHQELYEVFNRNTIYDVVVPEDAHVANVIGNMNYTDAYKQQEERKNGRW